jgi:hypothetical protein
MRGIEAVTHNRRKSDQPTKSKHTTQHNQSVCVCTGGDQRQAVVRDGVVFGVDVRFDEVDVSEFAVERAGNDERDVLFLPHRLAGAGDASIDNVEHQLTVGPFRHGLNRAPVRTLRLTDAATLPKPAQVTRQSSYTTPHHTDVRGPPELLGAWDKGAAKNVLRAFCLDSNAASAGKRGRREG